LQAWAYRAGEGGGGGGNLPSLLGKQNQSGNIRFTVGQYWLIVKINGTNSVNFVGNSVNIVGNTLSNRNFAPSTTILESFSGKFFWQSEKVGQISFRPPNLFLPVRPWLSFQLILSFSFFHLLTAPGFVCILYMCYHTMAAFTLVKYDTGEV
jgi:hypothetical protein